MAKQKWEHKRLIYGWDGENFVWSDIHYAANGVEAIENRLQELERDGWELVSVMKISDTPNLKREYYLKRSID
jgi:hypothetical protein